MDNLFFAIRILIFLNSEVSGADCVKPGVGYNYLGERDHDKDGKLCIPWNEVVVSEGNAHVGIDMDTLDVSELAEHNFCRRIVLPTSHPFLTTTSDSRDQIATSGIAPWCYVKDKPWHGMSVSPSVCFPDCEGVSRREKTQRTPYGLHLVDQNYNRMLDRIDLYFKSYDWGDQSYYAWKPSEQALSKKYHAIRVHMFFGAVGSLALIVILLIGCYFLKRNATANRQRREQALKEIYNIEDDNPMRQVISRPAPN